MRVSVTRQVLLVTGALLATGVCAYAVSIDIGSAVGNPGSTVTFQVKLNTEGSAVGGTTNDIIFQPVTPVTACEVNPMFAALSAVSFLPAGCLPGGNCTGVRAVMLVFGGSIPNGSVLYTCTVRIAANAAVAASFPLICSNATSSTPNALPLTTRCTNGEISVPGPSGGGGVCAAGDTTHAGIAWIVLLPPVMMLWRRRRVVEIQIRNSKSEARDKFGTPNPGE
jgi:hypothetical protein